MECLEACGTCHEVLMSPKQGTSWVFAPFCTVDAPLGAFNLIPEGANKQWYFGVGVLGITLE